MLLGLAAVGGILIAQFIEKRALQTGAGPDIPEGQAIISEIILAAVANPSRRQEDNPPLRQHAMYSTADYLALRITTLPTITTPIQLNARLLTASGSVIELNPPSFTLPPGQSTFCCWQISDEGTYTLQLFRPEGTVTTFPLRIRKAGGSGANIIQGI